MTRAGSVTELPGIGRTLEEKLHALLVPAESLPGPPARPVPARAHRHDLPPWAWAQACRRLFDELGIDSLEALKEAAEAERLRDVRGFGPRFEEAVLAAFAAGAGEPDARPKMLLNRALRLADGIVEALRAIRTRRGGRLGAPAGRLGQGPGSPRRRTRRRCCARSPSSTSSSRRPPRDNAGRARTRWPERRPARRRARPVRQPPAALHGLKAHNVALREAAVRRGLRVGVRADRRQAPPPTAARRGGGLRAPRTAVDPTGAARGPRGLQLHSAADVPKLVDVGDLRGDLHSHGRSDGRHTVEEMARAAQERGLEYLAITDHSASHGPATVTPDVRRHRARPRGQRGARRLRAARRDGDEHRPGRRTGLRRRPPGRARLGHRLGAHVLRDGQREPLTRRMVAAVEHPLIDAIGHPTEARSRRGRLCRRHGRGHRRGRPHEDDDRDQRGARPPRHERPARAGRGGQACASSSAPRAHSTTNLALARWGIATARRAWRPPPTSPSTPLGAVRAAAQARAGGVGGEARAAARRGRLRRPLRGETARSRPARARRSLRPRSSSAVRSAAARPSRPGARPARERAGEAYGPGAGVVTSSAPSASASSWASPGHLAPGRPASVDAGAAQQRAELGGRDAPASRTPRAAGAPGPSP